MTNQMLTIGRLAWGFGFGHSLVISPYSLGIYDRSHHTKFRFPIKNVARHGWDTAGLSTVPASSRLCRLDEITRRDRRDDFDFRTAKFSRRIVTDLYFFAAVSRHHGTTLGKQTR